MLFFLRSVPDVRSVPVFSLHGCSDADGERRWEGRLVDAM